MVALAIGAILALAIGVFATAVGLDRDRAFYPTVAIVIALLYSLFAVMGGSTNALVLECLIGTAFLVAAVIGFKSSLWIVAGVLVAHGVYDLAHPHLFVNPGVPAWWPHFCLTYDVAAGAYLAGLIVSGRATATRPPAGRGA